MMQTEEILINISPTESRVALLENGTLNEIFIERHNKLGCVGNIYMGTVVRVLPGMQAAFIDIGQSRTAFLHVNDMQPKNKTLTTDHRENPPQKDPLSTNITPKIEEQLYEGQRILVQVIKDQLGSKGSRLTTNISLPSRYLVYLPTGEQHIGISQRIDDENERQRLKQTLDGLIHRVNLQGGIIARTAAENITENKLEEDIYYLLQLWRTIQARQQTIRHRRFELIYQDLSLPLRAIRDLISDKTEKITVDHPSVYQQICQFANEFIPTIRSRIYLYDGDLPLFDVHRVEEDLKDALNRRVNLKSGGYLIIDQTEAMTTIDVNTGSFVSGRSLEDTVYKTNLEATHAIAKQLRLRNLGGIIILDFIDMQEQIHKDNILENLQQQLSQDYAKTNISHVSSLGLIEMTRKRTRESLQQQLCEPCPTCQGKGFIKSLETICLEIFREIMRYSRTYHAPKKFTILAHANIIDVLMSTESETIAELQHLTGSVIHFEIENLYNQEQYNIILG